MLWLVSPPICHCLVSLRDANYVLILHLRGDSKDPEDSIRD